MINSPAQAPLILIDSERLRRDEIGSYHASCQALDREARRLKTYESEDLPAFLTWVQGEFAEDLALVHEWTAMMRALEQLVEDVERYADWKGVSRRVALDVIEAARLEGGYEALWDDLMYEEHDEDEGHHSDDERWSGSATESGASAERSLPRQGASAEDKPANDYMKALYRKLVRALHPDVNGGLSPETRRLWHDVQEAYAWRDVHRLERLYEKIVQSGDDIVNIKASPIGDLRALRRAVEANLKRVRQRLRESQGHIAWGFRRTRASKTKLAKLRSAIGKDIAHDLAMIRMRREELETLIDRWRRPTTAKSRAKARRATGR